MIVGVLPRPHGVTPQLGLETNWNLDGKKSGWDRVWAPSGFHVTRWKH